MAKYRTLKEFLEKIKNEHTEARKHYVVLAEREREAKEQLSAEIERGWKNPEEAKAFKEKHTALIEDIHKQLENLRESTAEKCNEIKSECYKTFATKLRATGDALDLATVELLKSGILSAEELNGLADDFDGNCTMMRLIGKYMLEKGVAENNIRLRSRGAELEKYRAPIAENIETLIMWGERSIQDDRTRADAIAATYDGQAERIIEESDGIFIEVSE